ncbi:DUF2975 domain-containing protein [Rasiella sp. SM2506]|uniref:DUF2975 domain-containing protein n=1 Tax=Rasiella sp. SM2506 TaxID=3423914 RepID=UPI003D7B8B57
MKTNLLLKNLIDILFILMVPGIFGFLIILPFGMFNTTIGNIEVNGYEEVMNLPTFYWVAVIVGILTYGMMLFALWFLKKSARYFMDNNLLKEAVSLNLSKSGLFFILTAVGALGSYIAIWIASFDGAGVSLQYGDTIFIPLFLAIIGLFFKMISNALTNARLLKEENDLTI